MIKKFVIDPVILNFLSSEDVLEHSSCNDVWERITIFFFSLNTTQDLLYVCIECYCEFNFHEA